jgi:predicted ribosome quality control (RQC) complex YloA/Tae2 family protein
MNYYLYKRYSIAQNEILNQRIRKHIEKELKKVTDKLNNLKKVIDRGSKEEEYKKFGNLLLINLSLIQPRMDFVEVRDIYSGNQMIKIKLDTSLPYKKNADNYFEKAKNEKTRLDKANELFNLSASKFNKLKHAEEKLSIASALEDYFILMKELNIKDNSFSNEEENLSAKFKHYIILEKYNVYVGKDSKNNDLLTMKFAKQNDYWFHARKVPGSHVVLRVENKKEVMPKNILTKAASLAAFHSKAKTSGLAPVSYTQKKYVIKKKGMDPGEVALLREEVLIVKPEIPQGCEFISNE